MLKYNIIYTSPVKDDYLWNGTGFDKLKSVDREPLLFSGKSVKEDELQETCFIKSILRSEVYKQALVITSAAEFSSLCISRLETVASSFGPAAFFPHIEIGSILIIFQEPVEFQCGYPLQYFFFFNSREFFF